jgi:hypothetical protein
MKKVLAIVVAVALVLSFILPGVALAQPPLKVDKHKPVPATDVRLAAKVSVTRPGPSRPPKPPRQVEAATGILGDTFTGGRYAIVIGISDYPGTRNDLKYMDDDAQDMISALTGCYGFVAANIKSLIDKDGTEAAHKPLVATRDAILTAIEDIGKVVTPNDEVVFFFSGHGGNGKAQDGDSEKVDECIWAHDGSKLVPIWDGELKTAFEGYTTSRIIFIFDSCYAGGMTDLQASGRVLAMATTESTVGYEVSTLKNGEFTYYLVDQGMLADLADKYDHDNDPTTADVTVEEAWDYAKANCQLDKPTISDSFDNDLLL